MQKETTYIVASVVVTKSQVRDQRRNALYVADL